MSQLSPQAAQRVFQTGIDPAGVYTLPKSDLPRLFLQKIPGIDPQLLCGGQCVQRLKNLLTYQLCFKGFLRRLGPEKQVVFNAVATVQ